jgi:hypothetical protein
MVIGTEEVECRVEEPRLLQADEHRVGPVFSSQTAVGEPRPWPAGLLQPLGDADFGAKSPARFKDAKNFPGWVTSNRGGGRGT